MATKIQGSQHDFSFGEVDVALKRSDDHPARKAGLRQMANARILNSNSIQNRPGRRALFPTSGARTEEVVMSPGNVFKIAFGATIATGEIRIYNSAGAQVALFQTQGSGKLLPWTTATVGSIVISQFNLSIYIAFGHAMRPQVLTWDGVSAWAIADYTELSQGSQKRTAFYRISPQGIAIAPAAQTGVGVALVASSALFVAGMVGTRMRYVNRQILITAVADPTHATITIEEPLPGAQGLNFATNPALIFSVGDVVIGATTGSKGIVGSIGATNMDVQLLTTSTTTVTTYGDGTNTIAFSQTEVVVGPSGSLTLTSSGSVVAPRLCTVWDDEVMNDYRGYPASVFVDQFRLGLCDFVSVPNGIGWSAINSPADMYVGVNPSDAMFELAPKKVQVYYVSSGPEGSEFIFCDRALFYIPISVTNPLKPGSVSFQLLSGDGCAQVQPRLSQEAVLYVNAGQSSVMAVIATGAQTRPYSAKNLTDLHNHLFGQIVAIAVPSADGTFAERYAYILNADGSVIVGKYDPGSLQTNLPVIGWGPWSGAGTVLWVSAFAADVLFTSTYFGAGMCEILDDTQYLDGALAVNAAPTAFAPPAGKGPLWFIPSQSVNLMDQGTRSMGTYQVDANGFIVPQFNGGEDLTRIDLIAGQQWTMTAEPFAPNAQSGADFGQRMKLRQISNFAVYVINSTGFLIAALFSSRQTPTTPALGSVVTQHRVSAWSQGEDATLAPFLRETAELWTPAGASYDPRVAIIKDTPGPLLIAEFGMEISL